jgi:hypothetical protein
MGYIKEPEGVDFVINGKPLTEQQKKEITAFIKADKARNVKFKNLAIKGKKRPLNTTK